MSKNGNKVDWNVYLTGENGLTTHCNQIESCGVFLVNGDTLAQINLDHVSNFKEVKGGPKSDGCW